MQRGAAPPPPPPPVRPVGWFLRRGYPWPEISAAVVKIQEAFGARIRVALCPGNPTPEGEKGEDAALFCVGERSGGGWVPLGGKAVTLQFYAHAAGSLRHRLTPDSAAAAMQTRE